MTCSGWRYSAAFRSSFLLSLLKSVLDSLVFLSHVDSHCGVNTARCPAATRAPTAAEAAPTAELHHGDGLAEFRNAPAHRPLGNHVLRCLTRLTPGGGGPESRTARR